ncbi:hypothetical protein AJ80_06205 [Polytolypa hystricis UAMH7299]|uniref:ER membrane protein complex subunit 10 n=1 Tax=Polytolypa hystricis (strain UAMH7299) TaxID=1447883 RepID=A0A2B7XXE9_POLH7|nr:hypothetical protein AJ80_06205 [Polytolypa hystricis UAMH7299]
MYFPSLLSCLFASYVATATASSSSSSPLSTELLYWPLSSPNPLRLVEITYDPRTLESTVLSYTPPKSSSSSSSSSDDNPTNPSDANSLARLGLYTSASSDDASHWVGSLTSLSSFEGDVLPVVTVYLGPDNQVYHAAVSDVKATPAASSSSSAPKLQVNFVRQAPGPNPHLNTPIVLSPDGTGPEEVVEKSLIQKYWWVIGLVMVLAMTGGGDGK